MACDLIAFSDAIVDRLQKAFDAVVASVEVTRDYELRHDLDTFLGMKVVVFPAGYAISPTNDMMVDSVRGRGGYATRSEDYLDVEVAIAVAERWADDTKKPPREWLDDRVEIVDRCVFEALRKTEEPLLADEFWKSDVIVADAYDIQLLRQHRVFWCEVEAVFRKLRA